MKLEKYASLFLRRARLPKITSELSKITSDISSNLKSWAKNKKPALENFATAKGILENLKSKLLNEEEKQINEFLEKLRLINIWGNKANLTDITENKAWDLYTDLCTIVTRLEQLKKDSKWD